MKVNSSLDKTIIWTALVTPLNSSGEVDYESLLKLLKEQEKASHGILILGSTGEALNLSEEEKKGILEFCFKQNLNVPIMCGVPGIHLPTTLEWINTLEAYPIDAYLMVTPLYAKPGDLGQYHWFKTLLDASTKPSVLYNVPSRAGTPLSFDAIEKLKNHPLFWGIKEASGSVQEFIKYRKAAPKVKIYSGDDAMMPEFAKEGAEGLISVASNSWPQATGHYVKKCLENRLTKEEDSLWKKVSDSLFKASNPVPVKRLLKEMSLIESAHCKLPLHQEDLKNTDELKEANNLVEKWLQKSC